MTAAEPAKDRAWDVVDDVLAQYDPLIGDPAGRIVAALMADPALLVDLAIEAGGLVEDEAVEVFCDHVGGCRKAGCDLNRKVYRRTTQENAS